MIRRIKNALIAGTATLSMSLSALFLTFAPVSAATGYTLFDDATLVSPGKDSATAVQLTSDGTPGWGGVNFEVPDGLTYGELTTLSTDYNVTDDDCGGGSPRFSVDIDTNSDSVSDGNVVIHFGPSPSFTNCLPGWQTTGNLIGNEDAGRYDYSHVGGSGFTTYSGMPTGLADGTVLGITLVVDSGWSADASGGDGEQTVLADNTVINEMTFNFEPVLVTVTINKYIDGEQATAATANNAVFPMQSTWDTDNIGDGSGGYTLSSAGFNSPDPYEAITSEMNAGSDYSTNEVTGGEVVAASCEPDGAPFALVGYSVGDTHEEAVTAEKTTTAPSFTDLQENKYVIVWNETCEDEPEPEMPTTKDQCKKGNWQTYGVFKNQGDCVSYVATGGRNGPALF
jgi:hypothetical protein